MKELNVNNSKLYEFLENIGIDNVVLPNRNLDNQFVTKHNDKYYSIFNFHNSSNILEEKQATDLFYELSKLHQNTSFPRKLSPELYKSKFDELSKKLDYLFKKIEVYIRSIENRVIDKTFYPVLENYHIILDAKNELIRLQKKMILSIKDQETINYSFIHNNPKIDHLMYIRGNKYLISLDNGKMGIKSLDYAKFYVENANVNIDLKTLISNELLQDNSEFYYDYFKFIVLIIYLFRINISSDSLTTVNSFVYNCKMIEKFLIDFNENNIKESNSQTE